MSTTPSTDRGAPRRPSAAAAKRLARQVREHAREPGSLPTELESYLTTYVPSGIDEETWAAVRDAHAAVMRKSRVDRLPTFRNRCSEAAAYLAWRFTQGRSLVITDAFSFAAIDEYYARGCRSLSPASRNDRRSRLRSIAQAANPGTAAPPRAPTEGHQPVKPPYSPRDEANIKRVAFTQRRDTPRQRLCAVVGLCMGAGLSANELRTLHVEHISDLGDEGIVVTVPGARKRRVVVRYEYEELVRLGVARRSTGSLVIGKDVNRHNIVSSIVEKCEIFGDVPRIEAGRMRSTWLAWLVARAVPVQVILTAAGLQSARTLAELLPHLPPSAAGDEMLRGGGDR